MSAQLQAREAGIADALRNRPGLVEKCAAVIEEGLGATTWRWDKASGKIVTEPDYRERRESAKLLLSYLEGLPVQRLVTANLDADKPDLLGALKRSPNARRLIERVLAVLPPDPEAPKNPDQ